MLAQKDKPTIGVLIPTWKAVTHLKHCLIPLLQSPLKPKILVIDSSSKDGTVKLARSLGVEVHVIPQNEFNHGKTREWGRKKLGTDIVVMMTQDAYPTSANMLYKLVSPLINKQATVAYARQIPHLNANFLASFARQFNYPSTSHIRCIDDLSKYGSYTFFCSNSCAAYVNTALDEIGGFPETLFGEDTIAVAKLLHQRHYVAYVAEAVVRHSHNYTLKEEFYRHIDIGFSRKLIQHLIKSGGKDTKRGKAYTVALFKELLRKQKKLFPYALMQTCAKFLGYQIGKLSTYMPKWNKK